MNSLIKQLRALGAVLFEQLFFYLAAFLTLLAWSYSQSTYITIASAIILLVIAYYITGKIEGSSKKESDKK